MKPKGSAFVSPTVRKLLREYLEARPKQHWSEFAGDQNPAREVVRTLQLRLDRQRASDWKAL